MYFERLFGVSGTETGDEFQIPGNPRPRCADCRPSEQREHVFDVGGLEELQAAVLHKGMLRLAHSTSSTSLW